FQSFPDFMLGLGAAQNGAAFSNENCAKSICGDTEQTYRVNDYDGYFQDDIHISPTFTINTGVRWDLYGQVSDSHGRFADFWPELVSNQFGPSGQTLTGYHRISELFTGYSLVTFP